MAKRRVKAPKIPTEFPKPSTLYPERETVFCSRCRCFHWKGGRCFADDPLFREVVGVPVGRDRREKMPADGPRMRGSLEDVAQGKAPPPKVSDEERDRIVQERLASWERDAERGVRPDTEASK
jgi:hypothetical protein